jgi:hypothetical protein
VTCLEAQGGVVGEDDYLGIRLFGAKLKGSRDDAVVWVGTVKVGMLLKNAVRLGGAKDEVAAIAQGFAFVLDEPWQDGACAALKTLGR